ncbi:MAG: hypothetical protein WKF30_04385 [Pyrinomonadaceae bacterium]
MPKGWLMRPTKKLRQMSALTLLASLCFSTFVLPFNAADARPLVQSQQPTTGETLERGYRTGYSDGYQAGYGDSASAGSRDVKSKEDYQSADRTYSSAHGAREIFRDGYRQGYERGYETGYERRSFDSTVPADLTSRGVSDVPDDRAANAPISDDSDVNNSSVRAGTSSGGQAVTIQQNTVMLVQLETNLSTDASQNGDRIQARVMSPAEYEGAMLHGVVRDVRRPGKVRGSALLQIAFAEIRLPDGRWTEMEAQVIEVVNADEREIGEVDAEGGIRGKDSTKRDVAKVGAGAALGAIIGAIAGGGRGAAIGATVGGGAGAGGVLASRGDDLQLRRGDQLRIRTARTVNVR